MNKEKTKKICNVVLNVILYLFLIICIISLIVTLASKKSDDGAVELFGHQMRLVVSNSMAKSEFTNTDDFDIKSIPVRSMVFIELVPKDEKERDKWYEDLAPGDVLTFKYVYSSQVTITHRIDKIEKKDTGGYEITLTGDNKNSETGALYQFIDTSIPDSTSYVIGKVTGVSYIFGYIISLLKTVPGILLTIILPCTVIIILEVIRIVRLVVADKKQKAEEEAAKKDLELEELRKRIAELEGKTSDGDGDADGRD